MYTLRDISERLGITLQAAREYHHRATRRRREGTSLFHDLPAPTETVGRALVWPIEVIEAWIAIRPGHTGRPKKNKTIL